MKILIHVELLDSNRFRFNSLTDKVVYIQHFAPHGVMVTKEPSWGHLNYHASFGA